MKQVGALWNGSRDSTANNRRAFLARLAELGWIPGRSCGLEERFADGDNARLAKLANELLLAGPDVIFAPTTQGTLAVRRVSSQVPIVFAVPIDPVGSKLIDSLSRPGHRTTGVSALSYELGAKRIELLHDCVERLSSATLLKDPGAGYSANVYEPLYRAAERVHVRLGEVSASNESELRSAFAQISSSRPGGVIVFDSPLFLRQRKLIVESVAALNIPAIYPIGDYPDDGGLMSYGVRFEDQYRRAAEYVSKILNGANADDLPVEQPQSFDLVINLKVAKALQMTIPNIVLVRASRIIE
jgi:putative ABC transport system substrate-binding protein